MPGRTTDWTKCCVLAILAYGCSPFDGYHTPSALELRDDAGTAKWPNDDDDSDRSLLCARARVQQRSGLHGTGDGFDLTFIVNELLLGDDFDEDSIDHREIGFDLDGLCTEHPTTGSCTPPGATFQQIDGPGGRDNNYGAFLATYNLLGLGDAGQLVNYNIERGELTTAIKVEDYNGASVDSQVTVSVYAVTTSEGPGQLPNDPEWDGKNVWNVGAQFVDTENDNQPLYVDTKAYVADSMVVARFREFLLPAGVITGVLMQAELREDDEEGWQLSDGVFGGRLEVDRVLAGAAYANQLTNGEPVCTDASSYNQMKALLCAYADVNYGLDDSGGAPCDAMSIGWSFTAVEGELGDVVGQVQLDTAESPCPEEVSPDHDSCADLVQ